MYRRKLVNRAETKVLGIETRTTNALESDSGTARIGGLWGRFFQEQIKERIPGKTQPENSYEIYTDYEGDEHGAYTVVLGYEVANCKHVPEGLVLKTLPAGKYVVFTTDRGVLSHVVRDGWQKLLAMDAATLGGERRFSGDFEIFDERSQNPEDAEVDIYIALK